MKRAALILCAAMPLLACRQIVGIQPMPKPCGDPLMIDDMEDGDANICSSQERHGTWYSFGDDSSTDDTLTPNAAIPGGRGASHRAVHFTGGGFTAWGAITGFNFDDSGLMRSVYDAGNAGGLTFWMKSTTPVTVQVLLPQTVLATDGGGACVPATSPNDCNNHFAFRIAPPDSAWRQVQVPFTALRQTATGTVTWDPARLLGVQFLVGAGADFDLWIDDVAFYYCANTECAPTCVDPAFSVACAKTSHHAAGCFPAGTLCADVDGWCADPMLIDDMEDGDHDICATGGRHGSWYLFRDTSSGAAQFDLSPIPGGRGISKRAVHLTGSGLTEWGAGIGASIKSASGDSYDASAAGGVHFWMRGSGLVLVQVRIPATTPVGGKGGACTNDSDCNNHFNFRIQSQGDDWVEYRVPFAALAQGATGSATWDPSQLLAVELSALAPDIDLWVDDVSFYDCAGGACVPTCNDPAFPVACPASTSYRAYCWPAATDCANPPDRIAGLAVWGSGPADVWIGGYSPASRQGRTLRWNGSAWSSIAGAGMPAIFGLWGSGPSDLWSVGVRGAIGHWDGTEWTAVASGTTANLYQGVWGSGPSDVWAAGAGGTIVHWDGARWASVQSPTTQDLWGLWTNGPSDGWAVGVGGAILRLTAAGWSAAASGVSGQLDGVWGSGSTDVWAVGERGTILHWNGAVWASVASGTTMYLDGVWGSGPTDVWAVGDGGTILHWNGAVWAAAARNTTLYLSAVWGSGPSDVWASGVATVHYDGTTWSIVSTATDASP